MDSTVGMFHGNGSSFPQSNSVHQPMHISDSLTFGRDYIYYTTFLLCHFTKQFFTKLSAWVEANHGNVNQAFSIFNNPRIYINPSITMALTLDCLYFFIFFFHYYLDLDAHHPRREGTGGLALS